MELSALAQKLQLKAGQQILLVNAPPSLPAMLEPLPLDAALLPAASQQADVVLCFAQDSVELARLAPVAIAALKPDGMLWFAYPKGSSGVPTDLNRDAGWAPVLGAGWEAVRQIAVDAVWSALRFRRGAVRGSAELLEQHFTGPRSALRPLFDRLRAELHQLGPDVTEAPRDTYIAYGRRMHFAVIKTRARPVQLELGLRLPGVTPTVRLLPIDKNFGSEAATHKIVLTVVDDVDEAVSGWLRRAYASVA